MFFMYILKSLKDDDLYVGYTSNLKKRLKEHNDGLNRSTKSRRPFKLVYCECYTSEIDARERESNLKLRTRAFRQLKNRINRSIS